MDHSFEAAIQLFAGHIRFEKRYSPHTLRSYLDDLHQFNQYLIGTFTGLQPEDITAPIVRSWLASLKESGLGSRSINRKISTLKSFFKFCIRSGILTRSPMPAVVSPKTPRRLPGFIEEQHLDTLFRHVEFSDDWEGRTSRLAMQLLYQLGLRSSELINCRESQVDFANRSVRVIGKGNKERIIPLGDALATDVREYIRKKRDLLPDGEAVFLLVNDKGKKLYPKWIYRMTQKYLGLVSTVQKKSPHILRHSFATHLTNNGAELNAVKELLGHASLAATQVYTHNTIKKLKNIHRKAHPKG